MRDAISHRPRDRPACGGERRRRQNCCRNGYSRRKRGKRADQGARDSPHRPTTPHAGAAIARAVLLIACSRCRMAVASTAATCVGVRAFAAEAA